MDNLVEERIEKGESLLAEGKVAEAEKCFLEIVKYDSKKGKAEAYNNLGVIALQRRNIQQACAHFMKALEIDPFNKYAILNYSQVLRVQDRLHIAIPILEKVVEKHPNDEEIGQLLVEGKTAALKQLAQKGINQGVYERAGLLMITKNHLATLKQNLPGLFDNTFIPYELTIIDNNSNDGTVKWLKEVKNDLPIDLHVIFSETDKSMFEISNAFFEQSECRYLVRVSPEAEFHPGWLMELYNRYHKFAAPGEKCWLSRDAEAVHKSLKLDDALHLENRHDYTLFYEEQGSDIGITRFGQDRMFCPDGNPRLNYVFDCAEGNCLDVGCQYCAYTINLARRGLDVHAIDISASYINEARNRLAKELESVRKRVKLLQAWAEELPFTKCMFQTVLLSELLEHVIEPEKVIKEALRVLEPGGVIYISVPGYADNTLEHVRVFSEESILDLLSEFKEELDLSSIKWYVKAPNDHYILCVRKKKKESGFAVKYINRRASVSGNGSFPLISVHMIVWNRQDYIAEAIESVLNQTYQNFELIIVDDGSTDNTRKIVESFKCDKIKYFYKEHSGVVPSRNLARDKCTGDFIAFLDSDDIYEPNILEVGLATILGNPNVDAVYSNLKIIGPDSNVTGHIWQYRNYEAQELAAALFEAGQNVIPFGSMIIRKALSDSVGPFDRDFIVSFDSDYIARLAKYGKLKHIDLPLYRCRRHGSNISHFRTSTKERAKSTVLMLNKMLHIFSRQELFPEIQWQFLSPHASDAEFNYQVGKVFWEHYKRYLQSGYHHTLLRESYSYLHKSVSSSPQHQEARMLLKQLSSLIESPEAPDEHSYYDAKRYWVERGRNYKVFRHHKPDHSLYEIKTKGLENLRGETLIEIGCAYGEALGAIRKKFPHLKLTGVDISRTMLEHARENLKEFSDIDLFEVNGKSLPFRDNEFEIAYTHGCFIHVSPAEVKGYIQEVMRISKSARFCESSAKVGTDPTNFYYFSHDYEKIFEELGYDYVIYAVFNEKISEKVYLVEKPKSLEKHCQAVPTCGSSLRLELPGKLTILYLADCRSIHTQRYVHFFKERGHDVHVFDTSGRTNNLDGIKLHFPQQIQENGAKITFEDQFIHNVFALNRVIDEIKPDILHGHYLTGWCWWGAFTGFQPYIITSWGTDIFLDTRNEFNRRFAEFCLRESPLVTADSLQLMEATQKLGGSGNGIKYVPFGIDVQFFRPGYDVSELAKKLGVNGSKVVLSPRQFKPPANIDIIIKAIPKVVSKISDVVFILKTYLTKGSSLNEYERYLHELVKELNVEDHVMFMDDVDFSEMPTIYNLADVMVTLRDTDGSACSMLECMACKTPIVASDIGSMREWIIDGENGRLVDQHDPNVVADAIIEILADYEKRQQFEDASHSLVREKADYRKNWLEVEKLYYGVKRNSAQQPYASGLLDGDLSVVQENLKVGWRLIASHKLDEAKEAFLSIFRLGELTMQSHLKALIGLAKIEWKRGDTSKAKASYTGCLRLLQSFELDRRIDIKCR